MNELLKLCLRKYHYYVYWFAYLIKSTINNLESDGLYKKGTQVRNHLKSKDLRDERDGRLQRHDEEREANTHISLVELVFPYREPRQTRCVLVIVTKGKVKQEK